LPASLLFSFALVPTNHIALFVEVAPMPTRLLRWPVALLVAIAVMAFAQRADAACCYFSAQNADILQPAQKVFITWDPVKQQESFTVQPKFEGNALDFGMVIPTPTQPKLHEMPRDFFKGLAIYTILKKRQFARSKLLPVETRRDETTSLDRGKG